MSKPIEWSPRSKQDYLNLLDYLETKWGEKTIRKFHIRLMSILELIAERPEIYPASAKNKRIRRCVISRQTSLYYQIRRNTIELITLFDNRQNPSKIRV